MTQVGQIDEVLSAAIDRGDVPGVVAMAGTRDGVAYQVCFRTPCAAWWGLNEHRHGVQSSWRSTLAASGLALTRA